MSIESSTARGIPKYRYAFFTYILYSLKDKFIFYQIAVNINMRGLACHKYVISEYNSPWLWSVYRADLNKVVVSLDYIPRLGVSM